MVDICIQVWGCCYNPSDRHPGSCDGGGQNWSNSGYILKVEPRGFGNELCMEYERKRWLQVLPGNTGNRIFSLPEVDKTTEHWHRGKVPGVCFGFCKVSVDDWIITLLFAREILELRRKWQKFRLEMKFGNSSISDGILKRHSMRLGSKEWSQDLQNLETC